MSLLSKKQIKYRLREVFAYLINYLKPNSSDQVRVVIFAQGRTGSTLLESLLCSTGHFLKNGELLNNDSGENEMMLPAQFISGLSKQESDSNFIFHVKIYQLTRDRKKPVDPATFVEALYNEDFKVIALKRKNHVKHALSNLVAEQRGDYEKLDDNIEKLRIAVDCKSFTEKVEERIRFGEEEDRILANIKHHEIVYEDDLEIPDAHQRTIDKTLDFLSLEKREAGTKHRKVNTTVLEELISNYDEFLDCIKEHGWQGFLEK